MNQSTFCAVGGSIGIRIPNISKLDTFWTPDFIVDGIPWKVSIKKKLVINEYLAAHLYCAKKEKPLDWSQPAQFSIKLLSFDANVTAIEYSNQPFIYDHIGSGFGKLSFIKWNNLFDVNKSYVKNDTIQLEFHVEIADQNETTKSKLVLTNIEKRQEDCCWSKYRLTVTNIENLMAIRKPEIILQNISWYLTVYKSRSGKLGVYLGSQNTEQRATLKRTMSIKLLSSKGATKSIEKIGNNDVGDTSVLTVDDITSWTELLKPENGFVENGSIVMEVAIKMTQPTEANIDQAKRLKLECPICMDGFANKDLSNLPCGHMFCSPCINTAIGNSKRCPSCNTPATKDGLRRCFLPM